MDGIDRRTFVAGAVVGTAMVAAPALGATPPSGKQAPALYRYKVGNFEITAVHDGTWFRDIDEKFVRNAPFAT